MKYTVFIRDNETGETRAISETQPDEYVDLLRFVWQEGNYRCDCNRAATFYGDLADDKSQECGDRRFFVSHLELEDGSVIEIQHD